ncbi:MAG: CehA/McbA family metallohydrolase [Finegoldia sp.]|nr:CehA/McbA family metallohydrolase [Finegoldia sp.]
MENTSNNKKGQGFLDLNPEKAYGEVAFEIDKKIESISLAWKDNTGFLSLYLYGPDKNLYAQAVTVQACGKRFISLDERLSSPCCKSPSSKESFLGEWNLTYALVDNRGDLSLNITVEEAFDPKTEKVNERSILEEKTTGQGDGKGLWFVGDFHTHTIYSDGKMTREENNEMARKQGLDFFIPTDHNIFHYSWPADNQVEVFPGTEITSSLGHINLLFAEKNPFEDHSIAEISEEKSLIAFIEEAESFSLPSINHPFMPPWDFLLKEFPLDRLKVMEIINDPTYKDSEPASKRAIKAWNYLLNDSYKVTGIGGSDSHLRPDQTYEGSAYPSLLGDPKTFVCAKSKSLEDLKAALIDGEVVVSRKEFIDFDLKGLDRDNEDFSGEISLEAWVKEDDFHDSKLYLNWILDGDTVKRDQGPNSSFKVSIDSAYHWIRVDVVDESENLYGFTNPIYFNRSKADHKMSKWEDLMEKMANDY